MSVHSEGFFFSSIVTVSYSFLSHSLLYWLVPGFPSVQTNEQSGRAVKQQASEKRWEDYSGALCIATVAGCLV